MLIDASLLQGEIEKLANDYLAFVHFPPLFKVWNFVFIIMKLFLVFSACFSTALSNFSPQDELEKEVEKSKTVNLELVFGYHWKPGTGKSVSFAVSHTHTY